MNILCYGDSNTHGVNPNDTGDGLSRFPREKRWTGRLQELLPDDYVIEEGLGGRTTVFDDPTAPGRNGLKGLLPCLRTHQPLDLVILMLGTNDTKPMFNASPQVIADGMRALIEVIWNPYSMDDSTPKILVVSPILVGADIERSWLWGIFDHSSVEKSQQLAEEFRMVAEEYGCNFFDAATVATPCIEESVHLDEKGHYDLAQALAMAIDLKLRS